MQATAPPPRTPLHSAPLLATKLSIPPARPAIVPREHLLARLDESLAHPLTLVSAPAGFGKTTLLSAWARALHHPIAWLSLEAADNDPARFLMYVVAALQHFDPAIGQDLHAALEHSQPLAVAPAIGALVNDLLALPAPCVLVLDDWHAIDAAPVHEALRTLVTHQPPQLHLVIATREDPPLPLARLRACGQLLELRAQDLRFSPGEAEAFLRGVMGLALDAGAVEALDARIEGWPAGLQLAALSLRNHADPAALIAGLSGSHHFILSYLTDEVLSQLPADLQTFLLETCVLERLTGPLCEAVTGRPDSAALLETLHTANAFVVPLDDEHVWFRYHHLFADLLRSQLARVQPGRAAVLHARASEWYERQRDGAVDAVEHAFAAEDYPRAVRLLETYARTVLLQGYAQTVEHWLRRVPPAWRLAGPRANLAFAWTLLLGGRLGEVEPYLSNVEGAAGEQTGTRRQPVEAGIRAETLALRAALVSLHGDTGRACALAEEAVSLAPEDDPYAQGMARFALATVYNYAGRAVDAGEAYRAALPLCHASGNTLAVMLIAANLVLLHIACGRLHAAAELSRDVIDAYERTSARRAPALATLYGSYAAVLLEWNELDAAHQYAGQWLALSRAAGHPATIAYGSVVLSRIQLARGDPGAAAAALDRALQLRGAGMPAWVVPQVVAQQVALALAQGDSAAAAQVIARTGTSPTGEIGPANEIVYLAYLRLLHQLGRETPGTGHLDEALAVAGRLLASAEPAGRAGRVLETLALRALVHDARGDAGQALEDLRRLLAAAEPEGYVRLFINAGAPMLRLLRLAHEAGLQPGYVAKLLAAIARESGAAVPPQPGLIEPLSERELEVLRLLAAGLSYREIAARLVVSVNTVRYHAKNVYGKLGVDRRMAAIARARAAGLL